MNPLEKDKIQHTLSPLDVGSIIKVEIRLQNIVGKGVGILELGPISPDIRSFKAAKNYLKESTNISYFRVLRYDNCMLQNSTYINTLNFTRSKLEFRFQQLPFKDFYIDLNETRRFQVQCHPFNTRDLLISFRRQDFQEIQEPSYSLVSKINKTAREYIEELGMIVDKNFLSEDFQLILRFQKTVYRNGFLLTLKVMDGVNSICLYPLLSKTDKLLRHERKDPGLYKVEKKISNIPFQLKYNQDLFQTCNKLSSEYRRSINEIKIENEVFSKKVNNKDCQIKKVQRQVSLLEGLIQEVIANMDEGEVTDLRGENIKEKLFDFENKVAKFGSKIAGMDFEGDRDSLNNEILVKRSHLKQFENLLDKAERGSELSIKLMMIERQSNKLEGKLNKLRSGYLALESPSKNLGKKYQETSPETECSSEIGEESEDLIDALEDLEREIKIEDEILEDAHEKKGLVQLQILIKQLKIAFDKYEQILLGTNIDNDNEDDFEYDRRIEEIAELGKQDGGKFLNVIRKVVSIHYLYSLQRQVNLGANFWKKRQKFKEIEKLKLNVENLEEEKEILQEQKNILEFLELQTKIKRQKVLRQRLKSKNN